MSLDFYLELDTKQKVDNGSGIFIRENGQSKEITREEWDEKFPTREPIIIDSEIENHEVYSGNITHNLANMADEAGIYKELWRPDEIGIEKAEQLIKPLIDGLAYLQSEPEYFKQFNPANGWGNYEGLASFVAQYIAACQKYPEAKVRVWR